MLVWILVKQNLKNDIQQFDASIFLAKHASHVYHLFLITKKMDWIQ